MQQRIRRLVICGLLMALSIIATRHLSVQTPIVRVGFGNVPIILAGILFGPGWGFAVGALADLVGFFSVPIGVYFPGFTLSSGLAGAIPPLVLGRTRLKSSFLRLFLAIGISQVITSLVLSTYWIYLTTGETAFALLPVRALNQAVSIPIYTTLIYALRRAVTPFADAVGA